MNAPAPDLTADREVAYSIDEIQACDDVAVLAAWYVNSDRRELHLKTFIEAWRTADIDDPDWTKRTAGALAFCSIGKKWIERRILTLGGEVPYPPTDPRARQLRILNDRVVELLKRIDELEKAAAGNG
jgi:hypothetical protein